MEVSKNKGCFPPKWMVKLMENPFFKWMIWGVLTHYFRKHPYDVWVLGPLDPWISWIFILMSVFFATPRGVHRGNDQRGFVKTWQFFFRREFHQQTY